MRSRVRHRACIPPDQSSSKRPRHHQRELCPPQRVSIDAARSLITTSAPASRSAAAHRVALPRKNGSSVPATRYVRGTGTAATGYVAIHRRAPFLGSRHLACSFPWEPAPRLLAWPQQCRSTILLPPRRGRRHPARVPGLRQARAAQVPALRESAKPAESPLDVLGGPSASRITIGCTLLKGLLASGFAG